MWENRRQTKKIGVGLSVSSLPPLLFRWSSGKCWDSRFPIPNHSISISTSSGQHCCMKAAQWVLSWSVYLFVHAMPCHAMPRRIVACYDMTWHSPWFTVFINILLLFSCHGLMIALLPPHHHIFPPTLSSHHHWHWLLRGHDRHTDRQHN